MDLATKNAVWRKPSNNEKRLIKDLHYNDNLNGCKRFNFEYDELRLLSWADEIVEGASIFCLDIPDGVFIIYVSLEVEADGYFNKIVEQYVISNGEVRIATKDDII